MLDTSSRTILALSSLVTLAAATACATAPAERAPAEIAPAPSFSIDGDPGDALASCAAAHTMAAKLGKVTGEGAAVQKNEPLAEWHLDHAMAVASRDRVKARFQDQYRAYMASNAALEKLDPRAEPDRARELVSRFLAGLNGDLDRCAVLRGRVVEREARASAAACDGGDAKACGQIGTAVARGTGVAKDPARGLAYLEKGCGLGEARTCVDAGLMLAGGGGVPKDVPRSLPLLQRGCDLGDASGCANLALLYRKGDGIPKDDARAFPLFVKGCEGGNGKACNVLGLMYWQGDGVKKDRSRAAPLLRKACAAGNAAGCTNIGTAHHDGDGAPRDLVQAARDYEKACDGGNGVGCAYLASMVRGGEGGVAQDEKRATALLDRACTLGDTRSCR